MKPLHLEDRRRGVEVDPEAVVKNAGVPGGYAVDLEKKTVYFPHRHQLYAVARFLGRTLWDGARGFTAHGWHWQLMEEPEQLFTDGEE